MNEQTTQPIGLYPEDRERIKRILNAKPELKTVSSLVRFALKDLDERLSRRPKPAPTELDHVEPTLDDRLGPVTGGRSNHRFDPASPMDRAISGQPPLPKPTDDKSRVLVALRGRAPNAIDKLAKVPRGTTRNVLVRDRSLEKAAGGKLLKWVEKTEREATP